jgi:rubrerythrin
MVMAKWEITQVVKWNYSVKKFNSADEILNFAIIREIDANLFYLRLSRMVNDAGLAKVLTDLAEEELAHLKKLQAVQTGKGGLNNEDIKKIDFVDYADDTAADAKMNYTDLLVIGMKKEETSRKLYTDLASIAEGQEFKDIFLRLARQEARHKQRFESEYNQLTSQNC